MVKCRCTRLPFSMKLETGGDECIRCLHVVFLKYTAMVT